MNNEMNGQNNLNNQNNVNTNNVEQNNQMPEMLGEIPTNNNVNATQSVEELVKVKNRAVVPLIIIFVLIVILIGGGVYWYFNKRENIEPKEVFTNTIDKMGEYIGNTVSTVKKATNDKIKMTHKITGDLNSSDVEFADISKLIKNIEINLGLDVDYSSKIINSNVGLKYNSKDALNINAILNDKAMYLGLGNIYDKYIKQDIEDVENVWNIEEKINFDSIDKATKEILNIIKNNLKDEYFTKEKTTLNNVEVTKHTMTISNFKEYITNVANGIKSNNTLMNELKKLTGLTDEEITSNLDNMVEKIEDDSYIHVEVYLNKKNKVEKIVDDSHLNLEVYINKTDMFVLGNDDQLVIESSNDRYNVIIKDKDGSLKQFADVKIEDKYFEINYNYEGVSASFIIDFRNNANNIDLKMKTVCDSRDETCEKIELSLSNIGTKNKGDLTLSVKIPSDGIDELVLKDSYEIVLDSPITLPDLSGAIDYTELTEDDENKILDNVINNEVIAEIIKDLNLDDLFGNSEEALIDSACLETNGETYNETVDDYLIECRNGSCRVTDTTTNTIIGTKKCSEVNSL